MPVSANTGYYQIYQWIDGAREVDAAEGFFATFIDAIPGHKKRKTREFSLVALFTSGGELYLTRQKHADRSEINPE